MTTRAGSAFYTFDPSGNVAQRLDGTGAVLSSDLYDAFGAATSTASSPDVFGFSGQWGGYTDAETGLVLMTHRYYDPATGRFLTRDPLGYRGGLNLYAYTGNNPVNRADPSGLQTVSGGLNATGGLIGGSAGVSVDGGVDSNGNVGLSLSGTVSAGFGLGVSGGTECSYSPTNYGPTDPTPPGDYDPDPLPIGITVTPIIGGQGWGGWGSTGFGGSVTWPGEPDPSGTGDSNPTPPNGNTTTTVSGPGLTFGGGGGGLCGGVVSVYVGVGHFCRDVAREVYSAAENNVAPW